MCSGCAGDVEGTQDHPDPEWQWGVIRRANEHTENAWVLDSPNGVGVHAGERIRIRLIQNPDPRLMAIRFLFMGCADPTYLAEAHPDDAQRLWPHLEDPVCLCSHEVVTD